MRRRHLLALFLLLAAAPVRADDDDDHSGRDHDDDDDDDDHDDALRAVETRGVLELDDLLERFRSQIEGRVVDVTLLERGNRLAFRVTYVDPRGRVRKALLDAVTGAVLD